MLCQLCTGFHDVARVNYEEGLKKYKECCIRNKYMEYEKL